MISTPNDKYGFTQRRLLFLCLISSIIVTMFSPEDIFACNARSVKMFVDKGQSEAESSTEKDLSVFSSNDYYVRVEWKEQGSEGDNNNKYNVEIRELIDGVLDGDEQLIAKKYDITDDTSSSEQSEVIKVDTTEYADAHEVGTHVIFARVKRQGMDWEPQTGDHGANNICTVYQVFLDELLNDNHNVVAWRRDNIVVRKGDTVRFKALLDPSSAPWPDGDWPKWHEEADEKPDGEDEVTLTFDDLGTKTVKAQAGTWYSTVSVYVKEVRLVENTAQSYGFDDFMVGDTPYKSLKDDNATDWAKARIVRSPVSDVYFRSTDTSKAQLTYPGTPYNAGSSLQSVQVKGINTGGDPKIEANDGSVSGTNMAKMKVKVYEQQTKDVKVHRVRLNSSESWDWPFSEGALESHLNSVYKQCATTFDVSFHEDWDTVDYDTGTEDDALTNDGSEEDAITSSFADTDYDFNLFIVKAIKKTNGDPLGGFADNIGSYAFINNGSDAKYHAAHEFGHALGGLADITDKYIDDENLMSYKRFHILGSGNHGTRLRHDDWDDCNPTP